MIRFNKKKSIIIKESVDKPILNINKINFITDDKDWAIRLSTAILLVKFTGISNNKEIKSSQRQLSIGAFITPYHRFSILEMNEWFRFEDLIKMSIRSKCDRWTTTIELVNFEFKKGEILEVYTTDKEYILARISDWKKRIDNLYNESSKWISLHPNLSIKEGNPTEMYEELMQSFNVLPIDLETRDIYKNNKLVLSFKPKGLWMIGGNGRIDIISKFGSYILIDVADAFQQPNWMIYTGPTKKEGIPFSKAELFKLIDLL